MSSHWTSRSPEGLCRGRAGAGRSPSSPADSGAGPRSADCRANPTFRAGGGPRRPEPRPAARSCGSSWYPAFPGRRRCRGCSARAHKPVRWGSRQRLFHPARRTADLRGAGSPRRSDLGGLGGGEFRGQRFGVPRLRRLVAAAYKENRDENCREAVTVRAVKTRPAAQGNWGTGHGVLRLPAAGQDPVDVAVRRLDRIDEPAARGLGIGEPQIQSSKNWGVSRLKLWKFRVRFTG